MQNKQPLPTFIYTADSSYLGDKLEESPWWIFGGGKCRNACSGHEKHSDGWNECMDVCKERDTSEYGGGGFADWWDDIFKKPSASGCLSQCADDGCLMDDQTGPQSWECQQCIEDCENLKSDAGAFVEKEGGFFAILDKLGGIIQKIRGRGSIDANGNGNGWKPDTRKDRNTKMIWGAIILVFIIMIIGFLVFMSKKK